MKSPWIDQKSFRASASSLSSVGWGPLRVAMNFSTEIFTLHKLFLSLTFLPMKSDDIQPLLPNGITGPLNGFSESPFTKGFSHLPGSLGDFAAQNFSSKPDCNSSAEVPSFILRTALSAMPFVSDRRSVEVRWFHGRSSQDLPNSSDLSVYMTFGLHWRLQKLS